MDKNIWMTILIGIAMLGNLGMAHLSGNESTALQQDFSFGNEQQVEILGYTGHAMEPFLSRDSRFLFFNSLNDSINTNLYYARRISDNQFQWIGEVQGVNGEAPHLDAVASLEDGNQFYFISNRNYPGDYRNIQSGAFRDGEVLDAAPVEGDFYIKSPGWIIMDAEINPAGDALFYVNARFDGGALPKEADLGIALQMGTTFTKDSNSDALLKNINTRDFLEYAPSISLQGLELFFTRFSDLTGTQILVSRRQSLDEPFSVPLLIPIQGKNVEAPSISSDGGVLYYHKMKDGQYSIFQMTREKELIEDRVEWH